MITYYKFNCKKCKDEVEGYLSCQLMQRGIKLTCTICSTESGWLNLNDISEVELNLKDNHKGGRTKNGSRTIS